MGGIDPRPFSLRQLLMMTEEAQRSRWDHTAAIMATLININRDPRKGRAADPAELNPYRRTTPKATPVVKKLNKAESMAALKAVFIDHVMPKGIEL